MRGSSAVVSPGQRRRSCSFQLQAVRAQADGVGQLAAGSPPPPPHTYTRTHTSHPHPHPHTPAHTCTRLPKTLHASCIPEARAPFAQALPRVERIMSGAAFCHFTAAAHGDEQSSGKDQLPSAVSLVQHVRTADGWSVRLCSIDVERGSGERLQQRLLSGHPAQAHVRALLPHPSCTLLATLDDGGELLLWECCFQADLLGRPPSQQADQGSAESSAIQQLARLPGSFQCAAWLSLAATALVAAEPSGLSVFCRAPDGRWLQGHKLVAPDGPGVPGLWLSLHAFANAVPVAAESPYAMRFECSGFALRSDGYLGLWRASLQAGPAQPPAFEWVGQAEMSGATCATPLVRAAGCNGRLGRATARRPCLLGQALTVHSGWHSALCRRWVPAPLRAPWEAEAQSATLQLLGFSLAGARPALARGSGRGGGDRGRDRELRLRGPPSCVGGHLHWPQQRRIGRTPPPPPRERRGARLAACWHDDALGAEHGPYDGRPRAPGGRAARSRGPAALLKVAFCSRRHRSAATARQPQPQLGSPASPRMGPPVAARLCTLESRVRAAQIATRAVQCHVSALRGARHSRVFDPRPSGSSSFWSLSRGAHSLRWKRSWISASRGAAHPPVALPLAARGWTSAAPLTCWPWVSPTRCSSTCSGRRESSRRGVRRGAWCVRSRCRRQPCAPLSSGSEAARCCLPPAPACSSGMRWRTSSSRTRP